MADLCFHCGAARSCDHRETEPPVNPTKRTPAPRHHHSYQAARNQRAFARRS